MIVNLSNGLEALQRINDNSLLPTLWIHSIPLDVVKIFNSLPLPVFSKIYSLHPFNREGYYSSLDYLPLLIKNYHFRSIIVSISFVINERLVIKKLEGVDPLIPIFLIENEEKENYFSSRPLEKTISGITTGGPIANGI